MVIKHLLVVEVLLLDLHQCQVRQHAHDAFFEDSYFVLGLCHAHSLKLHSVMTLDVSLRCWILIHQRNCLQAVPIHNKQGALPQQLLHVIHLYNDFYFGL